MKKDFGTLVVESSDTYGVVAELHRAFEAGIHHLVFKQQSNGNRLTWVYPEAVATEETLQKMAKHLRGKPWMTDQLMDQFLAEVPWLRSQLT